jgi:hypothetical protein
MNDNIMNQYAVMYKLHTPSFHMTTCLSSGTSSGSSYLSLAVINVPKQPHVVPLGPGVANTANHQFFDGPQHCPSFNWSTQDYTWPQKGEYAWLLGMMIASSDHSPLVLAKQQSNNANGPQTPTAGCMMRALPLLGLGVVFLPRCTVEHPATPHKAAPPQHPLNLKGESVMSEYKHMSY